MIAKEGISEHTGTAKSRISVAMCTYNGSRFLREQLASISMQMRLPDEMVICDDGSTDSTPETVKAFARTVSFPVRFIRNPENLGSTKNFEMSIGLCTGDLIALGDQDDIWVPEKLARQAGLMERDPDLGGIFSDAELIASDGTAMGETLWTSLKFTRHQQNSVQNGRGAAVLARKTFVTGATLMFRANLRPLLLPIPSVCVHDSWIAWMLVAFSKLHCIPEPLIRYRIHPDQQLGVVPLAVSRKRTIRERLERYRRKIPSEQEKQLLELTEVERRLVDSDNIRLEPIVADLRRKKEFLINRARVRGGRITEAAFIVRNVKNYYRYEHGWKAILRDIGIAML